MEDYKNDKTGAFIIDALSLVVWIVMMVIVYKVLGFEIAVLHGITYIIWLLNKIRTKLKL